MRVLLKWAMGRADGRAPGRALYEPSGRAEPETEIDLHLGAWRDRALEALRR